MKSNTSLATGWSILQDVHDSGERFEIYKRDWNPYDCPPCISPWQPIERLAHLQLLLAKQPYFGRELRHFNAAPWWYRTQFATPPAAAKATLRFEGVDYYCKVYFNETLLGEHEGYANPFEFEVGHLLQTDKPNLLVVKVWSPWDTHMVPGMEKNRTWYILRNMLKGSCEHSDTFVQRDVNPVGIWRPVRLITHQGIHQADKPQIVATPSPDFSKAKVAASWPIASDAPAGDAELRLSIFSLPDGAQVAQATAAVKLTSGDGAHTISVDIDNPRIWSTWDHGRPELYRAQLQLLQGGQPVLESAQTFGVRTADLVRTKDEMTFRLNGRPCFIRGATYWPDVYISNVDRARYKRDLDSLIRAGMNAVRIHVHTENDEFYDLCDQLGVLVFQDSDLNWAFPTDDAFVKRAVTIFGDMIRHLRNHPAIACWICMNEATNDYQTDGKEATMLSCQRPGTQLAQEAQRLDATRPIIRLCGARDDPQSADGHDYHGSICGGTVMDIYGTTEKMSTEFGVDAPPAASQARLVPEIASRLRDLLPDVAQLHDYQYHLLKYYIEHYRMQKYAPCGGYFQFMWIDFCPQSFMGIYDYWGAPKNEGFGGGLLAMEEANMPVGIFMEYKDAPVALHAVNDLTADFGPCKALWTVTGLDGKLLAQGQADLKLGPDSHVRVCDLALPIKPAQPCNIALTLTDSSGKILATNMYRDPFDPPKQPQGHPARMDHEIGMRLWWA
jgi:beta-mannosidase